MTILLFIAGLFLGALLNVAIIRLPREKRLLGWPRCTRTGERLALWQLLPVLGWALQRGRARDGRPLKLIYPLVELLTAAVVVLLHNRYGLDPKFFYALFVCAVLIVTGAIDWLYRYIYTFVILGAALVALVFGTLVLRPNMLQTLTLSLMGAVSAGAAFLLFYVLAARLFPSASVPFGLGDVQLAVFLGAAFGFYNLSYAFFPGIMIAGLVSALILIGRALRLRNMPTYMSYGTYLCLGAILSTVTRGL
jgi:leader peptidase (prepilin peptidase)/N-methyltransferase